MKHNLPLEKLSGVWSASPTPFTDKMEVDTVAVRRMVQHQRRLGINGLFLAGTSGEGPWMPDRQRRKLVQTAVKAAKAQMLIAVQVTDNSAARILDNIAMAQEDGADLAVIAPPYFLTNAEPRRIRDLHLEAIRQSPLPIGIYDLGTRRTFAIPEKILPTIYAEENVVLVKDSSADFERMKIPLAARRKRPELRLLTGWEFRCVDYLEAGYNGVLLGGGIFNGYMAGKILEAVKEGELDAAHKLQERMNRMMYAVYGGKDLKCWLSGKKKLLVEMGIFRTWKNYPNFPLTASCIRAVDRVLEREAEFLMPWKVKKPA